MFKKLRGKLILINLGITSVVILVSFSFIYLFSTQSANHRPPIPESKIELYTDDVEDIITVTINNEKQLAARDLLVMLIVSGLAIELAVALVSYFLADMAIRPVKEAYNSQKVFVANASHEIKTPLAAISANLEAADIHGNKWISNVEKEVAKLTTLNNELLTLARTDLINDSGVATEVDLGSLAKNAVHSFEPRMTKTDFELINNTSGKTKINADDYTQILNILMDNAIKYCDQKISLTISNHELNISNDGATISKQSADHIFERFYQTDKTTDGVGLGLAIAKSIAERNNWQLSVEPGKHLTTFILKY